MNVSPLQIQFLVSQGTLFYTSDKTYRHIGLLSEAAFHCYEAQKHKEEKLYPSFSCIIE